jgi:type II secretory pathway predicted ATPase ExeA
MYLKFYGFKREPFHITPDPEFLYPSPSHEDALGLMVYGVEQRKGFVVISGEVGVGKTTIVRTFLERCRQQQISIIYILNSRMPFNALMKMIYEELGLEVHSAGTSELIHGFYLFLIEEYKQGRNVVLVIDEAQNLPVDTLEDLRTLSNLETSEDKLLQILLIGQPELEEKLNLKELRQIQQRIAVRSRVAALTPAESRDYIRHRLIKAGMSAQETGIFTRAALRRIVKQSMGIPRKINIICDNALISGFGYGKAPVPLKVVNEVIADLEGKTNRASMKWVAACAVLAFSCLVIAGITIYRTTGFSKFINTGLFPTFSSSQDGKGESSSESTSSSKASVLPVSAPYHQSTPSSAPASGSQSLSSPRGSESLKHQGGVAGERDSAVSEVVLLPLDPGAAKLLSTGKSLSSRDTAPKAIPPAQSEGRENSGEKTPGNFDQESGKAIRSMNEAKAPPLISTRPASGEIVGAADNSGRKKDNPNWGSDSSGQSDITASKSKTTPEEEPPDPNKLMDWFMNKRSR